METEIKKSQDSIQTVELLQRGGKRELNQNTTKSQKLVKVEEMQWKKEVFHDTENMKNCLVQRKNCLNYITSQDRFNIIDEYRNECQCFTDDDS